MTDRSSLGEFEHMLLAAVIRLGEEAYGASILKELRSRRAAGCPAGRCT
jgi:hypothetical protein